MSSKPSAETVVSAPSASAPVAGMGFRAPGLVGEQAISFADFAAGAEHVAWACNLVHNGEHKTRRAWDAWYAQLLGRKTR